MAGHGNAAAIDRIPALVPFKKGPKAIQAILLYDVVRAQRVSDILDSLG